jgi:4-diphosphocytidyl-2-C-methyl-D-erythritol kinase
VTVGDSNGIITVNASAKINLFLHITGKRTDGYHLLESLAVFTESGDRVSVQPSDKISLSISGPFSNDLAANDPDNLVLRAANLLARTFDRRDGVEIHLEKNLPVSSGIGGGSADAAATLRALVTIWNLDTDAIRLAEIGLSLGADVPVCLYGDTALMSGIGETIEPVWRLPRCALVLVNAGGPVPTPQVFAQRAGDFSPSRSWRGTTSYEEFVAALAVRRNDLSDAAISVAPSIGEALGCLGKSAGCDLARLSGSGGTCFGLYRDMAAARSAAAELSERNPDWWVVATEVRDAKVP